MSLHPWRRSLQSKGQAPQGQPRAGDDSRAPSSWPVGISDSGEELLCGTQSRGVSQQVTPSPEFLLCSHLLSEEAGSAIPKAAAPAIGGNRLGTKKSASLYTNSS